MGTIAINPNERKPVRSLLSFSLSSLLSISPPVPDFEIQSFDSRLVHLESGLSSRLLLSLAMASLGEISSSLVTKTSSVLDTSDETVRAKSSD